MYIKVDHGLVSLFCKGWNNKQFQFCRMCDLCCSWSVLLLQCKSRIQCKAALPTCCSSSTWNGKHTGQKQRRHDWHKTGKASGAASQWRRLFLLILHGIFNFPPEAHCFGPLTLSLTAVWILAWTFSLQ